MRNSKTLLTAGCFLAFFAFGFIDNLKGPVLPELLRSEHLSLSQGGTIFLGAYIGFIVATLLQVTERFVFAFGAFGGFSIFNA